MAITGEARDEQVRLAAKAMVDVEEASTGAKPVDSGALMARVTAFELLASAAEPDRDTTEETLRELWNLVGRYRKALYDLLMNNLMTAP
jgi:hypothetical protein